MVKIFKVELYCIDLNDEYHTQEQFLEHLEDCVPDFSSIFLLGQSSISSWSDDHELNKIDTPVEVFRKYFK